MAVNDNGVEVFDCALQKHNLNRLVDREAEEAGSSDHLEVKSPGVPAMWDWQRDVTNTEDSRWGPNTRVVLSHEIHTPHLQPHDTQVSPDVPPPAKGPNSHL